MQQAWIYKRGIELALGTGQIPSEYFDAVTETAEESSNLEYETNKVRALTKAKSEKGW
jgi:hypothetical protein